MRRAGQDSFFHADDQNTVWAVTDASGAVVERYDYEDFGRSRVLDPSGAPRAGSALGNRWRFTGRELDPESGLYWYRTRYYDPRAGRFTGRDTIGIWGDAANVGNGYTYVANNPGSWVDPFGLDPWWERSFADSINSYWNELEDRVNNPANFPYSPTEPGQKNPSGPSGPKLGGGPSGPSNEPGNPFDFPGLPPGWRPDWKWNPNQNPGPEREYPGNWEDLDGNRWQWDWNKSGQHKQPHWDKFPPRGTPGEKRRYNPDGTEIHGRGPNYPPSPLPEWAQNYLPPMPYWLALSLMGASGVMQFYIPGPTPGLFPLPV